MTAVELRRVEAEVLSLREEINSEVLRLRDLMIFIGSKSCTEEQLKAFTKSYAKISVNIDNLDNQIFKLNQKVS